MKRRLWFFVPFRLTILSDNIASVVFIEAAELCGSGQCGKRRTGRIRIDSVFIYTPLKTHRNISHTVSRFSVLRNNWKTLPKKTNRQMNRKLMELMCPGEGKAIWTWFLFSPQDWQDARFFVRTGFPCPHLSTCHFTHAQLIQCHQFTCQDLDLNIN